MAVLPHPLMIIFVTLLSHTALSASAAAATYNVERLGAKADGKTDSTKAFLAAWAKACSSPKPAVVYVPQGRFFLKNVVFGGECSNNAVTFRIAGTLVAPSNYRVIGDSGTWIFFEHVNGVTISGGILDAQGTSLWACKTSGKSCPSGATGLGEAPALAHAARNALVESVLPSALAPRLTTLYVATAAAAAEDKAAWYVNVTKMIMRGIRATTLQGRIAILVGRYK